MSSRTSAQRLLTAAALLGATAVLGMVVLQVSEVFCGESCQARSWALSWQLVAAATGLVAGGVMTVSAATGSRRLALAFMLVAGALLCAVAWDVAQDGWQRTPFSL